MENLLSWGYPGLMLVGFIAGSIVPFSSEAVLSAAIALGWPTWPCIICILIGNWLGASTNYFVGRFCSLEWIEKHMRIKREKIEKTKAFLNGRGVWFAAISFLPFLGNALVVTYGIMRTSFWKVGGLMLIGRFLRYVVWMYLTIGAISLFNA